MHPDDLVHTRLSVNEFLAGEKSKYDEEYRFLRKDGQWMWIRARVRIVERTENGEPIRIVGTHTDITVQKRAEEQLRLSAEITRNMAEGVVLVRNSDGVIVFTNPRLDELFGYATGELIGQNVAVLNDDRDENPEEIATSIIATVSETGLWSSEIQNVKKNGETFWSWATVSEYEHPEHGTVSVSVQNDITERKVAEQASIDK